MLLHIWWLLQGNFEINDSVFNNFVSRNSFWTLQNMNGSEHICFQPWEWELGLQPTERASRSHVYWALSTSCKKGMLWGLWRNKAIVNAILALKAAYKQCNKTRHMLPDRWQFEAFVVMVKWAVWKIIIRTLQRWNRILWAGKAPWRKWNLS